MKKKAVIFLTVISVLLGPIILVPGIPNPPVITLYTHGDG
ncbi:putative membrane protein [Paenibacillus riograndensis SBR5]|uniref:Putative membrane protein n=1 Tax=Paenibacillus riograndensis SBR5 TaxID=1073571 RepID=A0A0E4HDK8_9BACL|nr:putative membrane protein [Paenibacillus riograndensis SBR5]